MGHNITYRHYHAHVI